MERISRIIDLIPELPYFILSLAFVLNNEPGVIRHVYSVAFLYTVITLVVGLSLKGLFKVRRPKECYDMPLLRYDFPSMHAMISIGAVAYLYFVDAAYAIVLTPISLLYFQSRLELEVHKLSAVIGGAFIGVILGVFAGTVLYGILLPEYFEVMFTILFFILPGCASLVRIRHSRRV